MSWRRITEGFPVGVWFAGWCPDREVLVPVYWEAESDLLIDNSDKTPSIAYWLPGFEWPPGCVLDHALAERAATSKPAHQEQDNEDHHDDRQGA